MKMSCKAFRCSSPARVRSSGEINIRPGAASFPGQRARLHAPPPPARTAPAPPSPRRRPLGESGR